MRILRLAFMAVLMAVLSGVVMTQPASAHGGDGDTEGYVIVQQALSYLVNDTGPDGVAQALMKIDEALAATDQDGVAVEQVRQAKAALEAGESAEGVALLQGSITAALSVLEGARGEETGTSLIQGALPPRVAFSGWDWVFLGSSLLVLVGGALAVLFRPQQNLHDLRRVMRPHRAL